MSLAIHSDLSAMLLIWAIIIKRLFHVKMLFPITQPHPLCDTIFYSYFGEMEGKKLRGCRICSVCAYSSKQATLSMLISFMHMKKECIGQADEKCLQFINC